MLNRRLSLCVLAIILASGCSQLTRPEQAEQGERVDAGSFLHEQLETDAVVTVSEAYRAMVMLADGEDRYSSFAEREEALLSQGMVRPQWKLERDNAIDRGSVAYMVCQIIKIRGGVNREVFGRLGLGDRRYAVRELVYRDLMEPGADYRFIRGGELVDLIAKADQYMAEHGQYSQEPVRLTGMLDSLSAPASRPAPAE
jgi:hypothetical protein